MDESHNTRVELLRSWTVNAEAWTSAVREQAIPSRRLVTDAAIVAACARVIGGRPDVRALDVGCGEGWLTRELTRLGAQATGVDGSAALIDAARAAGGADYACVSYEQLESDAEVRAGPYDLIVCNFSLLDDRVAPLLAALARPAPMPWYFRTTGSWLDAARAAQLVVDRLEEPIHPESRKALSLLLELC
ncbi:MAG: class I SAM-dependent methyltransferase [Gemmatimonadaceae bacterium]|nr:class I SAM-dependent methyltransferase [Gemmatimonadaceae bacterium]